MKRVHSGLPSRDSVKDFLMGWAASWGIFLVLFLIADKVY